MSYLGSIAAAGDHRTHWTRFGSDLSDSVVDQGISLSRQSTDGEYRGYGSGHVNKAWVVNEDLMFSGTVADFSLEMMSLLLEDGERPTPHNPTGGAAGGLLSVSAVPTPGTNYAVGDYMKGLL